MVEAILSLKHVDKHFGETHAVRDVSFEIEAGKIFALIGPNGSGKTTLVKMIAGLLRPSEGEIRVCGHLTTEDPVAAKRCIGYMPDEPTVWGAMTGEEFLHFTAALFGVEERERTTRVKELLAIFGFDGIEKERFDQYSRGNRQKFSILSALVHRPKLLLIDEPIVGLDPGSARVAKNLFADFARNGGAILLVTHTLSAAEELADTIGLLEQGSMRASGTLDALRAQAKVSSQGSLESVYEALAV